jgi:glycosyltransferase involved in cell wall biosynthesis
LARNLYFCLGFCISARTIALRAVRILIFHGYLLRGTGSNVYNASLAQALKKLGHEVHLFCQDRRADELPWVGGSGPGSVTVHVPDIGGLLPVFVADEYAGFEVKTFPDLSEEELERYLDANVSAVEEVVELVGPPDAALANHLIMGPVILARAGLRYALKVHGSDLNYTVRPHPERFAPYVEEALAGANGILVGSGHTAADLFSVAGDESVRSRVRLGPPGVDTESFRLRPPEDALIALGTLADEIEGEAPDESFGRDGPAAAVALRHWADGDPRVLFVGKLLTNKGVHLLLEAWPPVLAQHPGARLLLAGFGDFRQGAEELVTKLDIAGSVSISGRLEHDEVAEVMPAADVLAMPSTFPEAFGMVAAEAGACGVPPVSADHSGMREVSRHLAEAIGPELAPLLSFPVEPDPVEAIAERINGWLALPEARRRQAGKALSAAVDRLWSWEHVAAGVIAASRGDLNDLPEVAGKRGE